MDIFSLCIGIAIGVAILLPAALFQKDDEKLGRLCKVMEDRIFYLRGGLVEVVENETPGANATVKRMVSIARTYLKNDDLRSEVSIQARAGGVAAPTA